MWTCTPFVLLLLVLLAALTGVAPVLALGGNPIAAGVVQNWLRTVAQKPQQQPQAQPVKAHACWREGAPRGHGVHPVRDAETGTTVCPNNYPERSGKLCYAACKGDWQGQKSWCWANCRTVADGVFGESNTLFCCETKPECDELMKQVAIKLPIALAQFIAAIAGENIVDAIKGLKELVEQAMQLQLPECKKLTPTLAPSPTPPPTRTQPPTDQPDAVED